MRHEIRIAGRFVGASAPPFVIAEMSGNHNQSIERALEIVDEAAKTGAHALKIQTYTPETMTLDLDEREFHIDDPKSLWAGTSLFKLYEQAQTPYEWHKAMIYSSRFFLFRYAQPIFNLYQIFSGINKSVLLTAKKKLNFKSIFY